MQALSLRPMPKARVQGSKINVWIMDTYGTKKISVEYDIMDENQKNLSYGVFRGVIFALTPKSSQIPDGHRRSKMKSIKQLLLDS